MWLRTTAIVALLCPWLVGAQAAVAATADRSGATHCAIRGYLRQDARGIAVRAAPRQRSRIIGRLPPAAPLGGGASEIVSTEFDVIGAKDGWLLIERASDPSGNSNEPAFVGPGWISGILVRFTIGGNDLRVAPAGDSRVVSRLIGETRQGMGYGPDSFGVVRVHSCQGRFAEVTLAPPKDLGLSTRRLHGWVGGVCSNQLTTCDASSGDISVAEEEARGACIERVVELGDDETCKVAEFGRVAAVDGHEFFFAIYHYQNKDGVLLNTRAVIFERRADGFFYVLFSPDAEGGRYETPKMIKSPAGVVLQIPGYESGTGNFNREQLYLWRDGAWREVDSVSWLATLARRLPKGLGAWKGIYPDYATMKASTPLWREGDGNAGPTGPRADLTLAWSGTRIELAAFRLRRPRQSER